MKPIPLVGQIVYSANVGNSARNREQKLTPMKVISVGRKYFKCLKDGMPEHCAVECHLNNWRQHSEYSADHELYISEQEWLDQQESKRISTFIGETFPNGRNIWNIPLHALMEVKAILEQHMIK